MNAAELHRWVGDVDQFMSTYWRREPVVLETDPPTPMDLDDIDAVLASGLLRTPYVEMIRAEDDIALETFTESREVLFKAAGGFADSNAILALLEEGATLLLRNTEQWHRPTAELVARLVGETGRRVEAFFFVTPPGHQGLPLHRDDADVFLLQVAGSKLWTVRSGPPNDNWRPGPVSGEPGPVLLDAKLTKGQVLYIPRGYAHSAVGAQGLSVHLSLTVREIGGSHLVRAVPRLLLEGIGLPARPLVESGLLDSAATLLEVARSRLATLRPVDLVRHAREMQLDQKINNTDTASVVRFAKNSELF
jgi:ribosomal protein L16 Arg81 hydroxylase